MAQILTASTLGESVPPFTPHAISVSLPTWRDNVGYEEGDKRVMDKMVTGYPRFFIHKSVQKLANIYLQKFGLAGEQCILCPSKRVAEICRQFIIDRSSDSNSPVTARIVGIKCPEDYSAISNSPCIHLHAVLFPAGAFEIAKQFWQHSGMGISSRMAEKCLALMANNSTPSPAVGQWTGAGSRRFSKSHNHHYFVQNPCHSKLPVVPTKLIQDEELANDQVRYLEERYGRNFPLEHTAAAKCALRRRIAGVLIHDPSCGAQDAGSILDAGSDKAELGPSTRGTNITEHDVFLYPTGMSAIWNAHNLLLNSRPVQKSVCFGFPYCDTLKILQKWGPGCHFFGSGLDLEIDALEKLLEELSPNHSPSLPPPVLALFTEFPSNPLLRSPNLPRLRAIADRYDFILVVDETIGNFVNVSVLPYADIVVSSLTKVFSGDSNVMGGSLVLNPSGRHYTKLKAALQDTYEDIYFSEDVIFMERNSRCFKRRIHTINGNAEAVCDMLKASQQSGGVIKEVYYPKYTTRINYDACRAFDLPPDVLAFGGLFSVTFVSLAASRAFFDALECHKGPSLGTSFTLACPYTVLAHYTELDWAAKFGVEEGLVRVSVGTEDRETLLDMFKRALEAAEQAA